MEEFAQRLIKFRLRRKRTSVAAPIKVFISYSTKDSIVAGKIKSSFEKCLGFEVFLAHDDLLVSHNWPKELFYNLNKADLFVPLLSQNFSASTFANQELGIAYSRELNIIPFSLDGVNSDGCIRDLQAHKAKLNNWTETEIMRAVTIVFFLAFKVPEFYKYRESAIESLVNSLLKSNSKRTTASIVDIILESKDIFRFNKVQVRSIQNACKDNKYVFSAVVPFPKLKKFLLENYNVEIDK